MSKPATLSSAHSSGFIPTPIPFSPSQPLNRLTELFLQFSDCKRAQKILSAPVQKDNECSRLFHAIEQNSSVKNLVLDRLKAIRTEVSQIAKSQQTDPKETLLYIADLFKNNKTEEGLREFSLFEDNFPETAKLIHGNLWSLKGSPTGKHPDYGRVAFNNKDGFFSLSCEKAEAIELLYSPVSGRFNEIIDLFESGNIQLACTKFFQLERVYPKIAESVYYQVWLAYGQPSSANLPEINHPNFGAVAFYNTHPSPSFQYQPNLIIDALKKVAPTLTRESLLTREMHIARRDFKSLEVVRENLALRKPQHEKYEHAVKNTVAYQGGVHIEPRPARFDKTEFSICPWNCVKVAAAQASYAENSVYVLNFANDDHAGGGYLRRFGSQEEELFRCTDLPLVLDHVTHGVQPQNFYPIHMNAGTTGGLYSPSVSLFRTGLDNEYQMLDVERKIGVGTFAAIEHPKLDFTDPSDPRLQGDELLTTIERLRTNFHVAYENGHDTLVLGAFGSGAFANPPEHIAELMTTLIQLEFKNCFKKIIFAVTKDDFNRKHNPEGNFVPFARAVQKVGGVVLNEAGEVITDNL
ncbi:MAG: TIGR02452 family protein [Verrucomicrobia bacterium]|nr:TIGR02452 family protein [Verrucomicrobiota bacterium]